MEYCVTGNGSRLADKWCIEKMGLPSVVLMERAALSVCDEVLKELKCKHDNETYSDENVLIICGCGNNGADGLAAGRILINCGINTDIYVVGSGINECSGNYGKFSEEFKIQYNILNNMDVKVTVIDDSNIENISFDNGNIIVDAIFGIGLSREVEGIYRKVIDKINHSGKKVISVDVPSGLCGDTGVVRGCCVSAYKTVTFGKIKSGIVLCNGRDYSGETVVKDIGFLQDAYRTNEIKDEIYNYYEIKDIKLIPDRVKSSNKGTYGRVTVIAGSENMSGAAVMCAKAVYRCGAGLVKVFTHRLCMDIIKNNLYEAIVDDYDMIAEKNDTKGNLHLSDADIVVIGPGLSVCNKSESLVREVLESGCKAVIDADGLNVIGGNRELLNKFHENVIITPHIKEMSRLCGKNIEYIREHIVNVAREFSRKYKCVTVIKDATTIISDNSGNITVNMSGNNGMSTGGSGDVLAGIIGGMLSQKLSVYQSAGIGVYLHGIAGDLAKDEFSEYGMMATDIINAIPKVLKKRDGGSNGY